MTATVSGNRERTIYLTGPITGCSEKQASDWRKYVRDRLAPGLVAIDPMRDAVDFSVVSERQLDDTARLQNLLHGREILERNRVDIARCDVLLANFLGAQRISIGSVGELFWADAFRKPVIIVREAHHNLHDHGLINAIAFLTLNKLDSAIDKINRLLI
jgi:Nucleoside 2-deoxyribosyltransferase